MLKLAQLFAIPQAMFVVHTDSYSGNFEREMTAFITGEVGGDAGAGDDEVKLFRSEDFPSETKEWFSNHVFTIHDEHGITPVIMMPTPGWFNDGHGNHWPDGADPEAVRLKFERSVTDYDMRWINDFRSRGDQKSKDYADTLQTRHEERIAKGPSKCHAYQSIGIMCSETPPPELVEFMKERAKQFTKIVDPSKPWKSYNLIKILGFELTVIPDHEVVFQPV